MTRTIATPSLRRDRPYAVLPGGRTASPIGTLSDMAVPDRHDLIELLSAEVAYLAGVRAIVRVTSPSLASFLR